MKTSPTKFLVAAATWKQILLSLGLALIGAAAFATSYEHQTQLAIAAGSSATTAPLFPVLIEAAIVVAMLVLIWWPDLAEKVMRQTWRAIGFWTLLSALGNAGSTFTKAPDTIGIPIWMAVAVNVVPTITQYFVLHIAHAALARDQLAAKQNRAASLAGNLYQTAARKIGLPTTTPDTATTKQPTTTTSPRSRKDSPAREKPEGAAPVAEFMRLADEEKLSIREIANLTGWGKSTVAKAISDERQKARPELRVVGG